MNRARWNGDRSGIVLVVLMGFGLAGCGGGEVSPPTEFTPFVSQDGAFALDVPVGWEEKSGSRPDNTYSWAEFSGSSSTIRVVADVTGSLIADISAPFGAEALDDEDAPVAIAHELKKDRIAEDFSNYKESPSQTITTSMGDARICRFVAGGGPSGRRSGFRCTMLTNNRRVTFLCHCPAARFDAMQPAFETVLKSVRRR